MPRLHGVRERRHQPFWDTLVRTTGNPNPVIPASATLFGAAAVGDLGRTNMQSAGQLASDQTYVILALRCWLFMDGTNRRANYLGTATQLYWTLRVGDKPMFSAPTWYFPSGGGVYGFDSATSIFNLGEPTQESILKLARPIIVPVRQNFAADAQWFPVGTTDARDGLNNGAADDQKVIQFMIDGLQTRDVQ